MEMTAPMADISSDLSHPSGDEWTVEDLERLPDDGRRYEIIDGSLVVSPAPAVGHQRVLSWLLIALAASRPPGVEVLPGANVLLPGQRTRLLVPDVLAVLGEPEIDGGALAVPASAVLLAVEIVSPSSVSMDRVLKPNLYAEAGIGLYWRVEPGPAGPTVHTHELAGRSYRAVQAIEPGKWVTLDAPWPVEIAPPGRRASC
jgi:Uma2 family endonuclease